MEGRHMRPTTRERRRRQIRLVIILWVVALLLLAAACGVYTIGRDDSGPGDESTPGTTTGIGGTDPTTGGTEAPTTSTTPAVTEPTVGDDVRPVGGSEVDTTGHYVQPAGASWNLLLVNDWNPVTKEFIDSIELTEYASGKYFDSRAVDALMELIDAGNEAGCHLIAQSPYRGYDLQAALFVDEVATWEGYGYVGKDAEDKASTLVKRPGCSEHHTGLACDILGGGYTYLTEDFANTSDYEWLIENCARFGFILRFPEGEQEAITGVTFEPWHYRYVGVQAATEIMERGLTLEEYLEEKGL